SALTRVVLVGDRGMLTQARIDTLKDYPGLGWVSALRSEAIRALVQAGALARSLFGTVDLAEITAPAFPGERLVACYNPLLAATEAGLRQLAAAVQRRRHQPLTAVAISLKAGKALGRHQMAKHFRLDLGARHGGH